MNPTIRPSPNFGYKNQFGATGARGTKGRHGHKVEAIVFHVFGGDFTLGVQSWFFRAGTPASYNDLVLKDGTWIQLVEPTDPAWANGRVNRPLWTGLKKSPNGSIINPNLYTHAISREGHNHQITPAQEKTLAYVGKFRAEQHKLDSKKIRFIGHKDIDSVNRAYCPGHAFNWEKILAEVGAIAKPTEYTVVKGDTFWRIAQRFGITVPELVKANPQVANPSLIFSGQKLNIPTLKERERY